MKKQLKDEISELLAGTKRKKDLIIVDTYKCEPGFYRHNGKVISTAELEKLSSETNKLIILYKKDASVKG